MNTNEYYEIRRLMEQRAKRLLQLEALSDYDGTPEIKELRTGKYIYIRKRVDGKLTSRYVGRYSDELYIDVVCTNESIRMLKAELKEVDKQLNRLGYTPENKLSDEVKATVRLAKNNTAETLYSIAYIDGIDITPEQAEDIIENKRITGVFAQDVRKILNLKNAWEFITDPCLICLKTDFDILCRIAGLVSEGIYENGIPFAFRSGVSGEKRVSGRLQPGQDVNEEIGRIISNGTEPVDTAILLLMYCVRYRLFEKMNTPTSLLFANRFLISRGVGLLTVPSDDVPKFRELLASRFPLKDNTENERFIKEKCLKRP